MPQLTRQRLPVLSIQGLILAARYHCSMCSLDGFSMHYVKSIEGGAGKLELQLYN